MASTTHSLQSVIRARPLPIRPPLEDDELDGLVAMFRQSGFDPHPGQREFLRYRDRVKVLFCGRRWGKSYTIALEMIMHVLELIGLGWDYGRIRLCALNYSQIREPFAYFKRLCHALGLPIKVHSTREERYYYVGPVIVELRPLANRKGLRGAGVTMLVIDEASQVDGDLFHYDLLPSVSDFQGRVLLAGTPKGVNWVVEYLDSYGIDLDDHERRVFRVPGEILVMRAPSVENPHIDPRFIESVRETMDPVAFAQEYEAQVIRDYLTPFPVAPVLLQTPLTPTDLMGAEWCVGLDYGYVEPSARVVVAKLAGRDAYYVESVGYETQIEAGRLPEWVIPSLKTMRTPIACDPSFFNTDGRVNLASILSGARLRIYKASASRTPRWLMLRDLLAAGKILVYQPACEPLIQEMLNARPRPSQPDDIDKPDHAISALSYAIEWLYHRRPGGSGAADWDAMRAPQTPAAHAIRRSQGRTRRRMLRVL